MDTVGPVLVLRVEKTCAKDAPRKINGGPTSWEECIDRHFVREDNARDSASVAVSAPAVQMTCPISRKYSRSGVFLMTKYFCLTITALVLAFVSVFVVSAAAQTYSESILYNFGTSSKDGINPWGGLIIDKAGNLYGTTLTGGDLSCGAPLYVGCGTVFRVSPTGHEVILHTFRGGKDGANPVASLVQDSAGNIYGETLYGGTAHHQGAIFKITPAGVYSIVHTFKGAPGDGQNPWGSLMLDASGNIYGTASLGGNSGAQACNPKGGVPGCGVVFKISPSGTETILYNFQGGTDGGFPMGNVVFDAAGNLYGAASSFGQNRLGVLFKVTAANQYSVLYTFCSAINCADGTLPANITMDGQGNLYGIAGPNGFSPAGFGYAGVIFEYSTSGVESALGTFCIGFSCPNGSEPYGTLLVSGGNLYGTTYLGGSGNEGEVYELTTSGVETILYSFDFDTLHDGYQPLSGVIADKAGNLYGTTYTGGTQGKGTVFKLTKN